MMLDFCILLLVRVMPSRLTMPLHHLIGTSGLKSKAVTVGGYAKAGSTAAMMPIAFMRGSESASDCVLNHSHNDEWPDHRVGGD